MKKFILFSLLVLLITPRSFSQFRFGPEIGVTGATVSTNEFQSQGIIGGSVGLNIGFKVNYSINDTIQIESGLNLDQYGFSASPSDGSSTYNAAIRYLDIPLVAKYNFGSGDVRFFAFAGGYFGFGAYGTSSSVSYALGAGNPLHTYSTFTFGAKYADLNPYNYGLTAGIGLKAYNYLISLKYMHGLSNADSNNYDLNDAKLFYRNLTLSVAYLF
jgi:Outer membrane protein beta-barrel domain